MAAGTGVRLDTVDIADDAGWSVASTPDADVFGKGSTTIEIRYSADDAIYAAIRRNASGELDVIEDGAATAVDRVRAWLTGRTNAQEPVAASSATATDRSQLYWDFWLQFRNRVANEHPAWKARAGTSRTSPNATLPAGSPRTILCSAFKPGPLRLELAFVDPNPAVNVARFEALRAKEAEFERALNGPAAWDEMRGKNDTRVYVVSRFGSVDERDQWNAMTDWLIEQHVRFKSAIEAVGGLDT